MYPASASACTAPFASNASLHDTVANLLGKSTSPDATPGSALRVSLTLATHLMPHSMPSTSKLTFFVSNTTSSTGSIVWICEVELSVVAGLPESLAEHPMATQRPASTSKRFMIMLLSRKRNVGYTRQSPRSKWTARLPHRRPYGPTRKELHFDECVPCTTLHIRPGPHGRLSGHEEKAP